MGLLELMRQLFAPRVEGVRVYAEIEEQDEESDEVDPFDPFPEPVRLEISDVFNLHTIRPREVSVVVEEYLREARRKGFTSVRIIHGKGVGVQREIVRTILARTDFVEHFSDAPTEAGGWGATIARLRAGESSCESD